MAYQKPNINMEFLKKGLKKGVRENVENLTGMFTGRVSALMRNWEKMRDITKNNYDLGLLHLENGNVTDAIFRFRIVTLMDPQHVDAWFFLGTAYMADRKMSMAQSALQKAVNLRPGYEEAAYMLAIAKGKSAKAADLPKHMPLSLARSHFDSVAPTYSQDQLDQGYVGHTLLAETIRVRLTEGRVDYEMLELGTGTGLCGVLLRDAAGRLSGVDISSVMLEQAALQRDSDGRKVYDVLVHKEMHEYLKELPDQSVDVVFSGIALSYVGELTELYAQVARILRPGGLFAFTADSMVEEGFRLDCTAGRYRFSEGYLKQQAQDHGLTPDSMEEVAAYPAYPMWLCVFSK